MHLRGLVTGKITYLGLSLCSHGMQQKHFYPLRWAVALGPITNRLSGLRERLSRWTEAHSHGFSKDPTVPTRVLNKHQHQAILGTASSFSGWLRPLWNCRNDHLPILHPSPRPRAGFSGNRPASSPGVFASSENLSRPLPNPSPANFGKRHEKLQSSPSVCGLGVGFFKHSRGNCGVFTEAVFATRFGPARWVLSEPLD